MGQLNMGAIAAKVGGAVAGLAVAGAVQKYLDGTSNEALKGTYGPLAMIAAGIYGPGLAKSKEGDAISSACNALMIKGVNKLMTRNFPSFLAGADDEMSGAYDDTVSGYGGHDEMIVSGPYTDSSVSGADDMSGVGECIN